MRPVLEKLTVLLQEMLQVLPPIGLIAREQDHVMGAFDCRDAVDLHEAELVDQAQQASLVQATRRRQGEALPLEKDPPRLLVWNENRHARNIRAVIGAVQCSLYVLHSPAPASGL